MSSPSSWPPYQFSLRWMLVLMTLVAVGLAMSVSAWAELIATFFFWLLPTPLVVAAVYSRGDIRTFSIGALVPIVSALVRGPWGNSPESLILNVLWMIFSATICGVAAVATRRWLAKRGLTDRE